MTTKQRLGHAEKYAIGANVGDKFSDENMRIIRLTNMEAPIRWSLGRKGLCLAALANGDGYVVERMPEREEITDIQCNGCQKSAWDCPCYV